MVLSNFSSHSLSIYMSFLLRKRNIQDKEDLAAPLKTKAKRSSEKPWYLTTSLHNNATQNTTT